MQKANSPGPGRIFGVVQWNFMFVPRLGPVTGALQKTGLRQVLVVRQIESEHAAQNSTIVQRRLGLIRDTIHARLEWIGTDWLPGLSRIARPQMDIAKVKTRHVVT